MPEQLNLLEPPPADKSVGLRWLQQIREIITGAQERRAKALELRPKP